MIKDIEIKAKDLAYYLMGAFRNIVLLTGTSIAALTLSANKNKVIIGEVIAIIITLTTIYINFEVYMFYKTSMNNNLNLKKSAYIRSFKSFWITGPFILSIHIIIIIYASYNLYYKLYK